jgi:hypothetical protein
LKTLSGRLECRLRHNAEFHPPPPGGATLKEEEMRKTQLLAVCTVASLFLITGTAIAATTKQPADTLKVDYFSNANTSGAPDATVHIINPGTTFGTICADIYVFDDHQEMSECCSCSLSPDSIRTLSVNTDLTNNPLTGHILSHGAIKIASSLCGDPAMLKPVPAIRAWATHIQNSKFTITEGESQDATLSDGEGAALDRECAAIELDGSGSGICTCGTGD